MAGARGADARRSSLEWRWKRTLSCGGFLLVAAILSRYGLPGAALACYLGGTAAGIVYSLRRALTAARARTFDINVLMVNAVAGALASPGRTTSSSTLRSM